MRKKRDRLLTGASLGAVVRPAAEQENPVVVALTEPSLRGSIPSLPDPSDLPTKSSAWPAPAKFFTINQVLAKHKLAKHKLGKGSSVNLAAISPTVSDAPTIPPVQSNEPFGLFTFRAPMGLLWAKWRKVEADIKAEDPVLARCRAEPKNCSAAAKRFVSLIKEASARHGRARIEFVNKRVNSAIRYMSDIVQWHEPDLWSAPLDVNNKGSFETGLGDCEDYAIAKYVALREAGVAESDLRVLLVRDRAVRLDHAVLAVRQNGHWLILDNRWSRLSEDTDLKQFEPLFALDDDGVKLFAAPYAALRSTPAYGINFDDQDFSAGSVLTEKTQADVSEAISMPSLPLLM